MTKCLKLLVDVADVPVNLMRSDGWKRRRTFSSERERERENGSAREEKKKKKERRTEERMQKPVLVTSLLLSHSTQCILSFRCQILLRD